LLDALFAFAPCEALFEPPKLILMGFFSPIGLACDGKGELQRRHLFRSQLPVHTAIGFDWPKLIEIFGFLSPFPLLSSSKRRLAASEACAESAMILM
jgi:hypothetical protein